MRGVAQPTRALHACMPRSTPARVQPRGGRGSTRIHVNADGTKIKKFSVRAPKSVRARLRNR